MNVNGRITLTRLNTKVVNARDFGARALLFKRPNTTGAYYIRVLYVFVFIVRLRIIRIDPGLLWGMAWVYRKYAEDYSLYVLQHEANVARRGLWGDRSPIPAFGMAPPAKTNVIHVRPHFAIRDTAVLRSTPPSRHP